MTQGVAFGACFSSSASCHPVPRPALQRHPPEAFCTRAASRALSASSCRVVSLSAVAASGGTRIYMGQDNAPVVEHTNIAAVSRLISSTGTQSMGSTQLSMPRAHASFASNSATSCAFPVCDPYSTSIPGEDWRRCNQRGCRLEQPFNRGPCLTQCLLVRSSAMARQHQRP